MISWEKEVADDFISESTNGDRAVDELLREKG